MSFSIGRSLCSHQNLQSGFSYFNSPRGLDHVALRKGVSYFQIKGLGQSWKQHCFTIRDITAKPFCEYVMDKCHFENTWELNVTENVHRCSKLIFNKKKGCYLLHLLEEITLIEVFWYFTFIFIFSFHFQSIMLLNCCRRIYLTRNI